MGHLKSSSFVWPPRGWRQFEAVTQSNGQAVTKDIQTARIFGLSYAIECEPIYHLESRFHQHSVHIEGWEYSIQNESSEYPVLSFQFSDRYDLKKPKEFYIDDIKALAKPIRKEARSARRCIMAGLFFIKQIQAGQVPDVDRVLHMYRLHPNTSLYEETEENRSKVTRSSTKDGHWKSA